jgi:RimJ/RimL family protein N-acetyltransferase
MKNPDLIHLSESREIPNMNISHIKPGEDNPADVINFLKKNWSKSGSEHIGLLHHRIIARDNEDNVIGFRSFEIFDDFINKTYRYKLWLCVVDTEKRRQGIGKYLTQKAIDTMFDFDGKKKVEAYPITENGKYFLESTRKKIKEIIF